MEYEEKRPAGRHGHRRRGRLIKRLSLRIILIAALILVAWLGWNYVKEKMFDKQAVTHNNDITDEIVMRKLESIGQLVTYSYEYANEHQIKDTKQIFGVNIPGTTHTIRLRYKGIIKAGYEVKDIDVRVDNDAKNIFITLPEVKVTDNYIDTDSLEYTEQNNVFNPISGDEITSELDTIKTEELEEAINSGLFDKAEGNAKELIGGLMKDFSGFKVTFTS